MWYVVVYVISLRTNCYLHSCNGWSSIAIKHKASGNVSKNIHTFIINWFILPHGSVTDLGN
jgi:hypothetical protein